MRKPNNYWTKERCQEEALKYETKNEFKKKSQFVYLITLKNNWINDICSHMELLKNKWTKECCKEEALKYNNRSDFCKKSAGAYRSAIKYKILDDICSHMIRTKKSYWTKERCHDEALKYKYRNDFRKSPNGAYQSAYKNNWLDDICSHMENVGNRFNRCIYVYEFSDNYVYIGLTFNIHKRNIQHLNCGPVYNHLQINNDYKLKILTDYISIEDAKNKEKFYITKYNKNGYKLLNTRKGGEIGGSTPKWTFDICLKDALNCKNLSEYRKCKSYNAVWRNNWTEKICKICNFDISDIIKLN